MRMSEIGLQQILQTGESSSGAGAGPELIPSSASVQTGGMRALPVVIHSVIPGADHHTQQQQQKQQQTEQQFTDHQQQGQPARERKALGKYEVQKITEAWKAQFECNPDIIRDENSAELEHFIVNALNEGEYKAEVCGLARKKLLTLVEAQRKKKAKNMPDSMAKESRKKARQFKRDAIEKETIKLDDGLMGQQQEQHRNPYQQLSLTSTSLTIPDSDVAGISIGITNDNGGGSSSSNSTSGAMGMPQEDVKRSRSRPGRADVTKTNMRRLPTARKHAVNTIDAKAQRLADICAIEKKLHAEPTWALKEAAGEPQLTPTDAQRLEDALRRVEETKIPLLEALRDVQRIRQQVGMSFDQLKPVFQGCFFDGSTYWRHFNGETRGSPLVQEVFRAEFVPSNTGVALETTANLRKRGRPRAEDKSKGQDEDGEGVESEDDDRSH